MRIADSVEAYLVGDAAPWGEALSKLDRTQDCLVGDLGAARVLPVCLLQKWI
jgi:hypothetical protein